MGCGDGEQVASLPADVFGARFLPGGEDLLVMMEGDRPGLGFFSLPGGELTDMFEMYELFHRVALDPDRTRVALASLSEVLVYDLLTRERIFDALSLIA